MPRQAVRVLPIQVPGVRQGQGRHVLPAAGGGLRGGLTCLVHCVLLDGSLQAEQPEHNYFQLSM